MKPHYREALRIAGAYALFGILWIFLSDRFLELLAQGANTLTLTTLQTWKGWGFVLFTSALIFLLSRRSLLKQAGLIEQVNQNQSDYHALFEQSPVGLALCHMDGSLVDVNLAFARILGRSVQETLSLTYWQVTPDSYASEEARQFESLQQTGRYGPYEKEYLHAAGHRVPVRLNGLIVEHSGERLIWSSVEDITERKQAEDALWESSEKLRLFAQNAPSAIAMFDRDMRYIAFSNRWLADYGLEEQELAGRSHYLIFPDVPERWKEIHQRSLAGAVEKCDEDPFPRADGSVDWVRWETRPWRTSKGEIGGIIIFSEVITERKQAEEENIKLNAELEQRVAERTTQLAAANRELEAFAYSVSHDLKAPLRGIDGYSQLLQHNCGAGLSDECRLFINNIRHGARQMNNLIDDLLAYSRMERRLLQNAPLNLASLVQAVVAERAEEIKASNTEVRVNLPPLSVHADQEGLVIALRNLLENALKFSCDAKPPVIEIGGREEEKSCIVWISDNGIGFDMKFHVRIFDIFQRLQRAEDYPGTGIGLALVSKAMQRMGGRVWAESSPDKGATFYLELPK